MRTWGLALALVLLPATAHAQHGKTSYYTRASCQREGMIGIYTANGEAYDETALTVALPHHHFGSLYRVCLSKRSSTSATSFYDKCVVVRHNDDGPSRDARRKGVVIDLSPKAFALLAPLSAGIIDVEITPLTPINRLAN